FDDRVALNSAVFYDLWKDIQTDQFRASGIPFTTNAGDAAILGLEASLDVRWTDHLSSQLNGRVARTRITHINPFFGPSLVDALPDAPATSGGLVVTYERPLLRNWHMSLVGETTYIGESRVNFGVNVPQMGGYVRTKLLA